MSNVQNKKIKNEKKKWKHRTIESHSNDIYLCSSRFKSNLVCYKLSVEEYMGYSFINLAFF